MTATRWLRSTWHRQTNRGNTRGATVVCNTGAPAFNSRLPSKRRTQKRKLVGKEVKDAINKQHAVSSEWIIHVWELVLLRGTTSVSRTLFLGNFGGIMEIKSCEEKVSQSFTALATFFQCVAMVTRQRLDQGFLEKEFRSEMKCEHKCAWKTSKGHFTQNQKSGEWCRN